MIRVFTCKQFEKFLIFMKKEYKKYDRLEHLDLRFNTCTSITS